MRLPKIKIKFGSGSAPKPPAILSKLSREQHHFLALWSQFVFFTVLLGFAAWIDFPPSFRLPVGDVTSSLPTQVQQTLALNILPANITFSKPSIFLPKSSTDLGAIDLKKGLDIEGGTQITLEADMANIAEDQRKTALDSAVEVIHRRVDLFGVSEPEIRTSVYQDHYRIQVELPGLEQPESALELIGQTAQLQFWESSLATPSAITDLSSFHQTELTGQDLQRAQVQFDPTTNKPQILLQFNDKGKDLFTAITTRNINKPLGIFLDQQPLTLPIVNAPIYGGQAVISGDYDINTANALVAQLNAGALPVPIKIVQRNTVGPSLGQESLRDSIRAGLIGLFLVAVFMILLYRNAGVLAVFGLVAYGIITILLYKLIPVTLSLPGITGLLLSIGMAVDVNILTFERMKEESRLGKSTKDILHLGFKRSWSSIKDANFTTLGICFILFNPFNWSFLNTTGPIRGFAVTLALGILISLVTGVYYSRLLLQLFWDPHEFGEKEKTRAQAEPEIKPAPTKSFAEALAKTQTKPLPTPARKQPKSSPKLTAKQQRLAERKRKMALKNRKKGRRT